LYGEDYIGRYGAKGNPQEPILGEPNGDERKPSPGLKGTLTNPNEPKKASKPAVLDQNHPIVEIICE
jgi:hypothetical protein